MFKSLFLFVFVLLPLCIKGQHSYAYRFEHLTVNDGLAQAQIEDIKEDHYGQLWISTISGLSLYDGYDLINYNANGGEHDLEYDHIFKVAIDTNHQRLWLATSGGFSQLDFQQQQFFNYRDGINVGERTNLSCRTFDVHVDHNGVFWGASYLGLLRYEHGQDSVYQVLDFENSCLDYWQGKIDSLTNCTDFRIIEADANERYLWLSGHLGLYKFDKQDQHFEQYQCLNEQRHDLATNGVSFIYKDNQAQLWVAIGNQLWQYNSSQDQFKRCPLKGINKGIQLTCMLSLGDNNYWLGTAKNGILIAQGDSIITQLQHNPSIDYIFVK